MDTLESRLAEVLDELSLEGDWNDRYRLLVAWGDELDPLPEAECGPQTEVSGCSSPLWLKVWWAGGVLRVQGSTPGILPKAMVALVCRLFDGLAAVSGTAADLLGPLDMKKNLSPTRYMVLERMMTRVLSSGSPAE